jgi:NADH:ubiquinone oxidoreductase subunit 6 (subunit J)
MQPTDAAEPGSAASIGEELLGRHVLAIELAGVLLLVGIVGAVAVARRPVARGDTITPAGEEGGGDG